MDEITLKKANELQRKIDETKAILDATQNQEAECILFALNDHSKMAEVCTDQSLIEEIRQMIITSHEKKLTRFQDAFNLL